VTTVRFRGAARLVRGSLLGAACLLITLAGHTAAGGNPADAGILLGLPLAVALGVAWAERRRSTGQLIAFVLGCQALLHVVMTLAAGHPGHGASALPGTPMLPGAPMLIGHLLAALAAALVLSHGEAVLHRWLAFLAALGQPALAVPTISIAEHPAHHWIQPTLALHDRLARSTPRRGPPI
jgi:cytochrome bd-type quinol oxidase subunit 2